MYFISFQSIKFLITIIIGNKSFGCKDTIFINKTNI